VILEQGITLEYADELGGALGTSSGGCIRLLNGLSPAMEFTTLVHEHAHLSGGDRYVSRGEPHAEHLETERRDRQHNRDANLSLRSLRLVSAPPDRYVEARRLLVPLASMASPSRL
jgi:hypothetical protein